MPDNVPLTQSLVPTGTDLADTPTPPLAGNYADDDAIAIDQYFEAADQGPETFDGLRIPHEAIPPKSRLVRQRYTFGNATLQGVLALPPDINRKHLIITVWAVGPTSSAVYSGEPFSMLASGGVCNANALPVSANFVPTVLVLDDYTGPLFVGSLRDGEVVNFEIVAVTS